MGLLVASDLSCWYSWQDLSPVDMMLLSQEPQRILVNGCILVTVSTHSINVWSSNDFQISLVSIASDHIMLLYFFFYQFLDILVLRARFKGWNTFSIPKTKPLRRLSESIKSLWCLFFNPIIEKGDLRIFSFTMPTDKDSECYLESWYWVSGGERKCSGENTHPKI